MSDQERISPYNINTIPSSQVMRTFKTYIMRIVWQTVIRIIIAAQPVMEKEPEIMYYCGLHWVQHIDLTMTYISQEFFEMKDSDIYTPCA